MNTEISMELARVWRAIGASGGRDGLTALLTCRELYEALVYVDGPAQRRQLYPMVQHLLQQVRCRHDRSSRRVP